MNANDFKNRLVELLSSDERILGIGQKGDVNAPLVPGKSDIDMFVLCTGVPSKTEQEEMQGYLEEVLDAKNDCYFPSRKRTEKAIAGFKKKPAGCYGRLLKIVQLAAKEQTIEESVAELRNLGNELKEI